jgi:hypothetical protein
MYTVEFSPFAARQRDKKMFNSQVMARSFIILPPPFSFPLSPCCWKKNFVDTFFSGWPTRIVYYSSLLKCEREREGGEMKARIKSERIVWAELYTFMYGGGRDPEPPQISSSTKGSGPASGFFNRPPHLSWKNKFCFLVYTRQGVPFLLEHPHTHTHAFCERSCVSVWISVAFHLLFLHPFYGRCCCCCCY